MGQASGLPKAGDKIAGPTKRGGGPAPPLYCGRLMPPKVVFWILLSSLAAAPLLAHHAVSLYDMKNPITVQGVVSRLEWTNPHAYMYLIVKNDRGQQEEWAVELDSPSVLVHRGWSRDTLKPGDSITCRGGRSKTGARAMKSATVELPGGQKLRS